jgi:hypothetical protein
VICLTYVYAKNGRKFQYLQEGHRGLGGDTEIAERVRSILHRAGLLVH